MLKDMTYDELVEELAPMILQYMDEFMSAWG
jgi:hypothetical protein